MPIDFLTIQIIKNNNTLLKKDIFIGNIFNYNNAFNYNIYRCIYTHTFIISAFVITYYIIDITNNYSFCDIKLPVLI